MPGPDTSGYTNRFDQGFDSDTVGITTQANGWSGIATVMPSGTGGVVSPDGSSHARFEQSDATGGLTGPFTRFDGYRADFVTGFETEVKIYLDPNAWGAGEGFDYSVAINNQSGVHLRDYIFHVTQDTSSDALLIGVSNNTNFDPREDLDTLQNHFEVTTAGWYTLKHNFYDNGSGELAVDMTVENASGSTLFTETLSTATDLISTVVGGNRYGWFTNIDVDGGILVDSLALNTSSTGDWTLVNASGLILGEFEDFATAASNAVAGNAVIDPSGEFVVGANLSIQDAVNAAGAGDVINVRAGTYAEDVIIDKSLTLLSESGAASTIIEGQNGALGAIEIDPNVDDVVIGGIDHGFTVRGNNGNGAIENAAIYLQGDHDNITIQGNIIEARGDAGLLSEYNSAFTNSLIDSNQFTGQTFEGDAPGGDGFSTQFNVGNNVPRQLVTIGNGGGDAASAKASNITFTNNVLSGAAGGFNDAEQEQGNTLATIDAANSLIDGNEFTGTTARYATALRVRRPDTDITNNSFDNSEGGDTRGVFTQNLSGNEDISGNTFIGGAGDDSFVGTPGDDTFTLGEGNDSVLGGAGDDTIDGGAGVDTAGYSGASDDYAVAVNTDATGRVTSFSSVTDINSTGDGVDALTDVEVLTFVRDSVTLDATQPVQLFDDGGTLVGTFDTIQAAVDAAANGYTVNVAAGTYREQVTVDGIDGLTIVGAGDSTVIEMVDSPAVNTDNNGEAVVAVLESEGVTLQDLQIDGRGLGSNKQFYGVYYGNAGGTVDDLTVTAIRAPLLGDGTPAGSQLGRAIFANSLDEQSRTLNVTNNTVTDFQKNGIDLRGVFLTVNVTGNDVVGSGFLPSEGAIAQNGIVLVFGPTGVISGNTISEIGFARGDYLTAGILGFGAGDGVEVTGNTITAPIESETLIPSNLAGIVFTAGESDDLVITGNTIDGALTGIILDSNVDNPTVAENTFQNMVESLESNTGEGTLTGANVDYDGSSNDAAIDFGGSDGPDSIVGTDGDDRIAGGLGDDTIDGGAGLDTAIVADGNGVAVDLADYDLSGLSAIGGVVSGTLVGPDGTETLDGIEVLEVANTGSSTFIVIDGMSIQAAINAASDGDTILVQPGTYTENLLIDKAITLLGAQAGVDGSDAGRGTGESVINGNATFGIIVESDDVVIDGFEITGFARDGINIRTLEDAKPGDASIGAYRSNVDIQNNWIHESGTAGQRNGVLLGEFQGGPTLSPENAELNDIAISGNRIEFASEGARAIGITSQFNFVELTDLVIADNDLDSATSLFSGANTDTFSLHNASITGNTFEGTVNSYNFFDSTIDGNTFNYVALFGVDNSTVSNNTFNVTDYYGLGLWGDEYGSNVSQNSTVSGNTFNYNTVETGLSAVSGLKIRDGVDASSIDFDNNTFNDGGVNDPSVLAKDILWDGGEDPDALDAADLQDSSDTPIDVSLHLVGKDDDDDLVGGDQDDVLDGGAGNDVLKGGLGDDLYIGGAGTDRAVIAEAGEGSPYAPSDFDFSGVSVSEGVASGTIDGPDGTETLDGVEFIEIENDGSTMFVVGAGMDLQGAIDAAGAGDTIYLLEGVHAGSFTIGAGKDGLQILGLNEGVAGGDAGRDLATGSGESTVEGRIVILSDGVTIDGVRFAEGAGGGPFELSAVHIQAADATIQNSVFYRSGAVDGDTSRAIVNSVGSGDGTTVANNAMTGWHTGTYVNGASNVSITGNEYVGNLVGMSADFYTGGSNLSIDGNTFDNTLEDLGLGAANAPGWGSEIAATNNSFTKGIFDYDGSANSNLNGAGNTFVPGSVTVSSHDSVFTSIQQAIDFGSTSDGDTVTVSAGTFNESVDVTKALSFVGAGVGQTFVIASSGSAFDVQGDLGVEATVSFVGFDLSNSAVAGIDFDDAAILGTLIVEDSNFEANGYNGLRIGGNYGPVALGDVQVRNSTFTGNGEPQSSSGDGDLLFFQYYGDATLEDLVIVGQDRGNGPGENAIQFRGDSGDMGTVSLTNVDISGLFEKVALAIYNYGSIAGFGATNVDINATTGWATPVNVDGVNFIDFTGVDIDVTGSNGLVALQGTSEDDTIIGGAEDAILNGKADDDVIVGAGGSDVLQGGDRSATVIVLNDDGTFDHGDGTGDVDAEVAGVEAIRFSDESVLTVPTPAGTATAATEDVFYDVDFSALLGIDAADYTFEVLSAPAWLSNFDPATGVASGTPVNGDVGAGSVQYRATETATGLVIEDTVSLTVLNVNDAPVSSAIAPQSTDEDAPFTFDISSNFSDVDVGDTLIFTATLQNGDPLPSWLGFNAQTGVFTGTPTNDDVGALNITVNASDLSSASATARTFTLTVNNTNDDPVVVGSGIADQVFDEDTPISFSVASAFDDVDASDTLTFSATGLPAGLSISPAGVISGTPTTQVGDVFTVTVTADDGNGGQISDAFDLTITGVNDAPVASDDVAITPFDANGSFSGTVGGTIPLASLATDVDDTLDPTAITFTNATYTTTTGESGSTGTLANLGFSYTPGTGALALDPASANAFFADVFAGLDEGDSATIEVFFTASDGALSDTGSIVFTVNGVAEVPELASPIADTATAEDSGFVLDVSSNFADVDSDLVFSATLEGGAPLPSWLSFNTSTGVFSGTPLNANVGTINVTVTATEQGGTANVSDTFALEVTNTNDAPNIVGAAPSITGETGSAITSIDLDNFFSDPDVGDTLTYSVTSGSLPAGLSLDGNTGVISGEPTAAFNGTVEVTASDGNGGTRARNLSIDITSSNTTPTVAAPFSPVVSKVFFPADAANTVLAGILHDVFEDAETADTDLVYTVTDYGGFDVNDIVLDAATGNITLTPDYSIFGTPADGDNDDRPVSNPYEIEITASDGTATVSATLEVAVVPKFGSSDPDGVGYLTGSTIYLDTNLNGVQDPSEISVTMDGDGDFNFSLDPDFPTQLGVAAAAAGGNVQGIRFAVESGSGTNLATGNSTIGQLLTPFAVSGSNTPSTQVTPVTTLLAYAPTLSPDLLSANSDAGQLGVGTAVEYVDLDYTAVALNNPDGDSAAREALGVAAFSTIVRNGVLLVAKAVDNLDNAGSDVATLAEVVDATYEALALAISVDRFSFTDLSDIGDLVAAVTTDLGIGVLGGPKVATLYSLTLSMQGGIEDALHSYDNFIEDVYLTLPTDGSQNLDMLKLLAGSQLIVDSLDFASIPPTVFDSPSTFRAAAETNTVNVGNVGGVKATENPDDLNGLDVSGLEGEAIDGLGGNDTITGGEGLDTLDGGAGVDTLDYSDDGGAGGVNVNIGLVAAAGQPAGTATDTYGNFDIVSNFENVIGTAESDTITGNAGDNVITLPGQQTGDVVNGGAGVDTVVFDFDRPTGASFEQTGNFTFSVNNGGTPTLLTNIEAISFNDGLIIAPSDVTFGGPTTIAEGTIGDLGAVTVMDSDQGSGHNFSVSDDSDSVEFTVNNGNLEIASGSLDYESDRSIDVTIEATDDDGLTFTRTITLNVTDVDEAPVGSVPDQDATEDTAFQLDLSTLLSDPEGNTLSFTKISGPAWLGFNDAGNSANLIGTPTDGDVTTGETVFILVSDGNDLTDRVVSFDVSVANTNDAPTSTAITAKNVDQDAEFTFDASANFSDVDIDSGDVLTYSAELQGGGALPSWLSFNTATGVFSGTPADSDVGAINVTVNAQDPAGATATARTFALTVNNVNDAPTAGVIPDQAATEEQAFTFNVAGFFSDVDSDSGDTLTFAFSGLPNGLSGDSLTGAISGIPDDELTAGDNLVTVTATDGGGLTVQQSFNISVSTVNDAPVAKDFVIDDAFVADQVGQETIAIGDLATDADTVLDPSSVTPTGVTIGGVPQASVAAAGVSYDSTTGEITFDGRGIEAYEQLGDGARTTVVVTFDATDGNSTDTGTITFEVVGVNDTPELLSEIPDQAYGIGQSVDLSISSFFDDVDIGDTLIYTANALPDGLSLDSLTGALTGNPTTGSTTEVTITVSDGSASVTDTFSIVVSNELTGTANDDTLTATAPENFTIRGLAGDDLLTGLGGNDSLLGGDGDDSLFGAGGDDTLIGGSGDDFLDGGDGNNVFDGGFGEDTASFRGATAGVTKALTDAEFTSIENLEGSGFADVLTGNTEDNYFYASGGNDLINGGDGLDVYSGITGTVGIFADLQSGIIFGGAEFGIDTVSNIEGLEGTNVVDVLNGDSGSNIFYLTDGADQIDGRGGLDAISGEHLDVGITVDLAAETVSFNPTQTVVNIEYVIGTDYDDNITGDSLDNLIAGGEGNDTLNGAEGNDYVVGQDGDDVIDGGAGDDSLGGEAGNDTIDGGEGRDSVFGGDGDDVLDGGAGDDTIGAGSGDDTVDGGAGEDTLLLEANSFFDATVDFAAGTIQTAQDGTITFSNIEKFVFGDGSVVRLVSDEGTVYSTIQSAIDDADAGDTIVVDTAVYAENITIDKGITLFGLNQPQLDASGGINGITITGGGADQAVTISNLQIAGAQDIAVRIDPSASYSAVSLSSLLITDAGRRGISLESTTGVEGAPNVDAIVIQNVDVDGYGSVSGGSGVGININGYNGAVELTGVTVMSPDASAHYGINISGGNAPGSAGVNLTNVTVGQSGDSFVRAGLAIQDFAGLQAGDLLFNNVAINGSISDLTKDFALLYVDNVSGLIETANIQINEFSPFAPSESTFNIEDTGGLLASSAIGTSGDDAFLVVGDNVEIQALGGDDVLTTGATGDVTTFDGGAGTDTVNIVNPASLGLSVAYELGGEVSGVSSVNMTVGGNNAGRLDLSNTENVNFILGDDGDAISVGSPAPTAYSLISVTGGAGADSIDLAGTSVDLAITGGEGDDTIGLGSGDNTVDGGIGDDRIETSGGTDTITGGEGIDTVVVSGNFDPANFSGNVLSQNGTKTLSGVETVEFDDVTVQLVGRGGFATIQAAIDNASAGDIVFVEAGTYAESLTISKGVTLLGEDGTVLNAAGNLNGIVISGGTDTQSVVIDNVDIANAMDIGVRVDPTSAFDNLTLQYLNIVDSGRRGFSMEDGTGATGSDIANLTFREVEVDGFGTVPGGSGAGINVNDFANNASLIDVSIVGAGSDADYGINVTGGAGGAIGTVTLVNVQVGANGATEEFNKAALAFQDIADMGSVSASNVNLWATVQGAVEDFSPLFLDEVDGAFHAGDIFANANPSVPSSAFLLGFDTQNRSQTGDVVTGTGGNDVFTALGGSDSLNGVGGNDVFRIGSTGADVAIDGGFGTDEVAIYNVDPATPTTFDITDQADTSGFDLAITGGLGGSATADNVEGIAVNLGDAGDTVSADGVTNTDLSGVELAVNGGDGNDLVDLNGSVLSPMVDLGGGDDTLIAGNSAGEYDGGDGVDALDVGANGLTTSQDVFDAISDSAGGFVYDTGNGLVDVSNVEHLLLGDRTLIAAISEKRGDFAEDTVSNGQFLNQSQDAGLETGDFDFTGDELFITQVDGKDVVEGEAISVFFGALVTVTDVNTGEFTYDPNGQFNFVNIDQTVVPSFTYTVSDGSGVTQTETFKVVIFGANDPVVFDQATFEDGVREDAGDPTLEATGDLTFVDLDEGGTYSRIVTPAETGYIGTLVVDATPDFAVAAGSLGYSFTVDNALVQSLGEGETIVQEYTIELDDGEGSSDTTTLQITITGENDAPVFDAPSSDTTGTTDEDTKAVLTGSLVATDVDANDTPTFADAPSKTVVTWNRSTANGGPTTTIPTSFNEAALIGAFQLLSNGDWTYDPTALDLDGLAEGESLEIAFLPTITSGEDTIEGAVTITLTGVNDGPVANVIPKVVVTDLADPGTVAGLFSDPDGTDKVTITGEGTGLPSFLDIAGDGTISRNGSDQISVGTFSVTGVEAEDSAGLPASPTGAFDIEITLQAALSVLQDRDTLLLNETLLPAGNATLDANNLTLILEEGTDNRTFEFTLGDGVRKITTSGGSQDDGENFLITGNGEDNIFMAGTSAGNDTLIGGSGTDLIDYSDATEGVTVLLPINNAFGALTGLGGGVGTDSLSGFEDVRGTNFNDTIVLNGQDNVIFATRGTDNIEGNGGVDTIDYSSFSSSMLVDLANKLGVGVEGTQILSGMENVIGTGVADNITGNDSENLLKGAGGSDTLDGGLGDDMLRGGADNDFLFGGGGADELLGGTGADAMSGGAGDDFYQVDNIGDTISENDGEGHDLVEAYITFSLRDHSQFVEDLRLRSSADIDATGNGLDNVITGNQGDNFLNGAWGDDTLIGGRGADTLRDAHGDDSMEGGSGADLFVIRKGHGNDIIGDFRNNDTLDLTGLDFEDNEASTMGATDTEEGVFFDFGGDNSLLVRDVTFADIQDDILF